MTEDKKWKEEQLQAANSMLDSSAKILYSLLDKNKKWRECADELYEALCGLPNTERSEKACKKYEELIG